MTEHDITLTVNGTEHDLTVEARTLLAHALRDELGYTGTNIGCESSLCGACTVEMDGEAVKSCTALAVQADGAEITTVEGLSDGGEMHAIQRAFQEEHGLQCGYCTPGMMMTSVEILKENPNPTREEIREGLEGNLCRCTGYQNIVNAVQNAAESMGSGAVADGGTRDGGGSAGDGPATDGGTVVDACDAPGGCGCADEFDTAGGGDSR
ncbi:(2Fe-2S)-binding protein [Halobaculum magnesiiphilum]|uniref:(2Fe-2S)-binding protein n=1 Tax=Halobaculum magnesiiphilum TaxID=1017351 RepID=A0A8T8WI68_9EURY|nr:(2Fe-2S)-binding protein [Halobaculum magnesiiphilum]QZP39486.1 (2Fe-2S)-binding protein [Halobaculum magnesiiphilum]